MSAIAEPHVATLHYSAPLARRAALAFVRRALGRDAIALVIVAGGMGAWWWFTGEIGWGFGFLCGLLAVACVLLPLVFVLHYRNTVGKFRALRPPQATLRCDERGFTVTSNLGSATLPWSQVKKIWRFDDFWLLLFSRSGFITLPLADLDEPTRLCIAGAVAKID